MLLYIITNAVLFSFLMTHENIPQAMAQWLVEHGRWASIGFLLVVNVMLLLAGNFMEPSSIILITGPHPVPRGHAAGDRPGPFRDHHRGQHGNRHVIPRWA